MIKKEELPVKDPEISAWADLNGAQRLRELNLR